MALEDNLVNLILRIERVIKEIDDALDGKNTRKIDDIRYSSVFLDELENAFNGVNEELALVNEQMSWAEPTRKRELLRNELIIKYDKMYYLFDVLVKRIGN